MKKIIKNNYIKLSLGLFFLCCFGVAQAAPIVTLTPINGTCVSDCRITVNASNTTGDVTYSLLNYPITGQQSTPQSSNVFTGLMPGTYTVGVYDASTGGSPVTAATTLTTSYVGLSASSPLASYTSTDYCTNNGTISISFSGGKAPFRVKIMNQATPYNSQEIQVTTTASPRTASFTGLPSGQYAFEIQDACDQWQVNVPGNFVTVNGQTNNLTGVPFTALTTTRSDSWTGVRGTAGDCSRLQFEYWYSDLKVTAGGSTLNLSTYTQIKFRVEYPVGSGNYNTEGWVDGYSHPIFTITNYNRAQTNGDKYNLQVQHPCSGVITSSLETIPPEFFISSAANTSTYTDYCTMSSSPLITIGLPANYSGNDNSIWVAGCGAFTVVLKNTSTNAVVATKTIAATSTTTTSFSSADGIVAGGSYYAEITRTSPTAFSQTITGITVPVAPAPIAFEDRLVYYDHTTSTTSYVPGYNYQYCDYETTGIYAYLSSPLGTNVTYTIAATGGTPLITRSPITLTTSGRLWTDLPWGTYNITANYGCNSYTRTVTLTKTVSGFTSANTGTFQDYPTVCGRFSLIGDAYFHLNGTRVNSTLTGYRYYMLIVDGPDKIGTRAAGYSSNTSPSYKATIADLPGGTYRVIYYPYFTPVSTQTINGKSVTNYPTNGCFVEETIIIPEYIRPIINIPLSGGISCSSGFTNMTINVLQGSKPPFSYRYKSSGAADATYTPSAFQSGNVFPDMTPGNYTVQVKDDCGSITTQDVRVFNGTDQFVGIIGEVQPGVVCETREVILSVLSIGPVQSYAWTYRPNDETAWVSIGSDSPTYVINSAQQNHKGEYRVEINNGLCYLTSSIYILDVLPPAGTPTVSGAGSFCPGSSTTLTANTGVASPTFQWYKNGETITGANSSTYVASSAGSYTVVVTPYQGCPSDPSAPKTVLETCIALFNDSIYTVKNKPVTIDALANDYIECTRETITGMVITTQPGHGTASVQPDKNVLYTPASGWVGVDSLEYSLTCNGNVGSGKIYIVTLSPLANQYIACPTSDVTLGFTAIPDVQYYWYSVAASGIPVASGSNVNSLSATKDNLPLQTWYVEIRWKNGIILPRYRVDLELSENCGSSIPLGCATTGTLLFREDFGGNATSSPAISTTPLAAGITTYGFHSTTTQINQGEYAILKAVPATWQPSAWYHNFSDHTYPNDITRGYMLACDAAFEAGQFYQYQIDNLCTGTTLYFSEWLMSLVNSPLQDKVNHILKIEDLSGNVLAQYSTGNVPDADNTWKVYGFEFTVPGGQTSVIFKIINNSTGSIGNDFVIDDIEIRFCAPSVTLTQPSTNDITVCAGSPVSFSGSFTDDSTFGDDLISLWEYSSTGDVSSSAVWSTVSGTTVTSTTGTVTNNYNIASSTMAQTGYYRLVVANSANINSQNCRAVSNIVHMEVETCGVPVDITVFLQGPMTSNGTMTNYIQQPVDGLCVFTAPRLPVTDPYGTGAVYYNINDVGGSAGAVVDWVKVEIRRTDDPSLLLETKALLLKPDGQVVDTLGNTPLFTPQSIPVYLVVRHRNHLSVVNLVNDFSGTVSLDFSTSLGVGYRNISTDPDPMMLSNGKWSAWAGDSYKSGTGEMVNNQDHSIVVSSSTAGDRDAYLAGDFNMDGVINSIDISIVESSINTGVFSPVLNWGN